MLTDPNGTERPMNANNVPETHWPDDIAAGPDLPPGRIRPVQIVMAGTLLADIQQSHRPADRVLQHHFRAHHGLGRKDRQRIQSMVYFALRHWRLLDWMLGHDDAAPSTTDEHRLRQRLGAAIWLGGHLDPVLTQASDLNDSLVTNLTQRRQHAWETIPAAVRHSLTDTDMDRLTRAFGADSNSVAQALNRQAPVTLRINPMKTDLAQLQRELADEGISTHPIDDLPLALRVDQTAALTRSATWRAGKFEIQDVGSQRIVDACAANPGERVLDLCAGAGGKSLSLAASMRDQGQILACDVDAARLERMAPRIARGGWHAIDTLAIADSRDPALQARAPFDIVLIDAPCSGSGTWRRHPELKQADTDLSTLATTQQTLLEDGARLTKPGGRMVYATCSLWREENEDRVEQFLTTHPDWQLLAAPDAPRSGLVRLRPDRDDSDGFFYAVLQAPSDK